jgi:hypothetical protein
MVTAALSLVRHSKDTSASFTSGLDLQTSTALVIKLFLEASLVACKDGKEDTVLSLGATIILKGELDMDDTVFHVIMMALHGVKRETDTEMAALQERCEANFKAVRGSKLSTSIFEAYNRLRGIVGTNSLGDPAVLAEAVLRFRTVANLFSKSSPDEDAATMAKRTRFRILHASILHASGGVDEAQLCWEAILTDVMGMRICVKSVTSVFDLTESKISISTGQLLLSVCGTSGVTVVGTMLAKLAEYSLASNVDVQKELLLVAARCFEECLAQDTGLHTRVPHISGVSWTDLISACEFTAATLLKYELCAEAEATIDLMVRVASEMCRDQDLYVAALALRAHACAIQSDFSGAAIALTMASRQREWSLLLVKLAASESISHQVDSSAGHPHENENCIFAYDQPLWAAKSGFHKNGMVINHIVILDFAMATHLHPTRVQLLQIERVRVILLLLNVACPEMEGIDVRNENKPSKAKRRHMPYGPGVNRLIGVAKDSLEVARRYGVAQGIPPLVLDCAFLMSQVLIYEGQQRGALTLLISTVAIRSTHPVSGNSGIVPSLSVLWWLDARVQVARVLYMIGQIDACQEECVGLAADAAEVNDRTIVLAALDLLTRCKILRGKGDLTMSETYHFMTTLRDCKIGGALSLQYHNTVATALEFGGQTQQAYTLISTAEQAAREKVVDDQPRNDFDRTIQVLGATEALRADLASTLGDKNAVIDAATIGLRVVGASLVHQQPFLLAELLLTKAGCSPESVTMAELNDIMLSAINGGRILLARRACVAAVRHSIATTHPKAAVLFMATATAIFVLRKKVQENSVKHELDAPKHAVLGPIGDAVVTNLDLWDDRHDIAAMAPAVAPMATTIDGSTLFQLREAIEQAACLAEPPMTFRMAALIDDITSALNSSPHYSLISVKDYASRQTLLGTKVGSPEGGISFMWESSATCPTAYLFVVCAAAGGAPRGYERQMPRSGVFKLQTGVRNCVTATATSYPENLASQISEILQISATADDLNPDVFGMLDQLLSVRDGGGQISGGDAVAWFAKCLEEAETSNTPQEP